MFFVLAVLHGMLTNVFSFPNLCWLFKIVNIFVSFIVLLFFVFVLFALIHLYTRILEQYKGGANQLFFKDAMIDNMMRATMITFNYPCAIQLNHVINAVIKNMLK